MQSVVFARELFASPLAEGTIGPYYFSKMKLGS